MDAPALAALGSNEVGVDAVTLPARLDRALMLRVWYPARQGGGSPVTYAAALAGPDGVPVAFTVPGIAIADAPPAPGRFPLVLVAHGYGNNPEAMAWLCENLASKGYVVVAPAFRDPPIFSNTNLAAVIARRPLDIAFVAAEAGRRAHAGEAPFAHADPDQLALIGYSMGGYGVLTAAGAPLEPSLAGATQGALAPYVAGAPKADALKLADLKAVVAISPPMRLGPLTMWAPGGLAAIRAPTFFIVGSQDHLVGYDPGVRTLFEAETNAPRYLLTFREAGHNIGLSGAPPEMQHRLWDQDWFEDPVWRKARLMGIEAHFITAFLDRYVKGDISKAPYITNLVVSSDDGTWPNAPKTYGGFSPGPPLATLWKGFQPAHSAGMTFEFIPKK